MIRNALLKFCIWKISQKFTWMLTCILLPVGCNLSLQWMILVGRRIALIQQTRILPTVSCMWGLYWHCCDLKPATIQPIKVQMCTYETVLYLFIYTFSHFLTKLLILKNPQDFCAAHLCLSIFFLPSVCLVGYLVWVSFVVRACACVCLGFVCGFGCVFALGECLFNFSQVSYFRNTRL